MASASSLNIRSLLRPDIPHGAALPTRSALLRLLLPIVLFGMLYGAVLGAFGGITPDRWEQMLYSAIKVPMLLLVTFAVCLPSFFVLNTLLGVRDDFGVALRALISVQSVLTIVLASFAPYTAMWYVSTTGYGSATLFNGVMFFIASIVAQFALRRLYRPLIAIDPRHRILMRTWLVLYVIVGIQMAWVLRPFVGNPATPTTFFRTENFGNAFEAIGRLLW